MDLSENLSTSKGPMKTLTKPMKMHARNAKVQLTDPETGKTRTMKALGPAARRIYRKQILAGTDPAFVLPRALRWQPDGGGRIYARQVNAALGTNFNTILLNKYKDGDDCIGFHRDGETGWAKGTGFATLSFGAERDFQVRHEATGETRSISHRDGHALYLPAPMNQECLHGVPKRKKVKGCRISLTFCEIV